MSTKPSFWTREQQFLISLIDMGMVGSDSPLVSPEPTVRSKAYATVFPSHASAEVANG